MQLFSFLRRVHTVYVIVVDTVVKLATCMRMHAMAHKLSLVDPVHLVWSCMELNGVAV